MKKNNRLALAAAVGGFALMSTAAMAAVATGSVNVRTGPSTGYAVVDTLYPGEFVEVDRCATNGWCYVIKSGPDGWVSSRYLTDGDRDEPDIVIRRPQPSVSFSFSFGRGEGFSFGGPRGSQRDLVCLVTFYERSQVEGGADADVQRAQVMTRAQAEAIDRPNDRRRIFDYGTNAQTRDTCRYLDRLN
jgi:uncharacterized protein YraI